MFSGTYFGEWGGQSRNFSEDLTLALFARHFSSLNLCMADNTSRVNLENNQSTESTKSRALLGCFYKLRLLDLFFLSWEWQHSFRTNFFKAMQRTLIL